MFYCQGGPHDGSEVACCNVTEGHILKFPTVGPDGLWQEALYKLTEGVFIFTEKYEERILPKVTQDSLEEFLKQSQEPLTDQENANPEDSADWWKEKP